MQLTFASVTLAAVATSMAVAQCDLACAAIRDPVCGSNNKTYSNACVLKVDACTSKETITVAKQGECTCGLSCTKEYAPVCGSDDVTYGNKCTLALAQCKDATIQLVKEGWCPCPTFCQDIGFPVCGSDGKTYGNDCDLKSAACKGRLELTKVSNGACAGTNGTNGTDTIALPTPYVTTPSPRPTYLYVASSSPLVVASTAAIITSTLLSLVLALT